MRYCKLNEQQIFDIISFNEETLHDKDNIFTRIKANKYFIIKINL